MRVRLMSVLLMGHDLHEHNGEGDFGTQWKRVVTEVSSAFGMHAPSSLMIPHPIPAIVTTSVSQTGSTRYRTKMVGESMRSARALDGLPPAWGAKAQASVCYWHPFLAGR